MAKAASNARFMDKVFLPEGVGRHAATFSRPRTYSNARALALHRPGHTSSTSPKR